MAMTEFSRRTFAGAAAALALRPAQAAERQVRCFRTPEAEVDMQVEFHDVFSNNSLQLVEEVANRRFCLSREGQEDRNCMRRFRGSLAIVRYHVRPLSRGKSSQTLREYVRTIDHDARLSDRPPFERIIRLKDGVGSDLQAFGYEGEREEKVSDRHGPWYLYRQDLYLERKTTPFLVLYWKHALSAIRMLDIIPGEDTQVTR